MVIVNNFLISITAIMLSSQIYEANFQSIKFGWVCGNGGNCQKTEITAANSGQTSDLSTCQLLCSAYAGLWPRPTSVVITSRLKSDLREVSLGSMKVVIMGSPGRSDSLVEQAGIRFKEMVALTYIKVEVQVKTHVKLTLETDESYSLKVSHNALTGLTAHIVAKTFFGARHGLETLSQVLVYDDILKQVVMPISLTISDAPKYPLRGVMLDTSRSYISVSVIKRTLEGMASSKLNTFHWHITDSHSFPYVVIARPQLSESGAYSRNKVYTSKDIKDIVAFARVRGIRVIAEYDAPAHVGEGWQYYPDSLVACVNTKPWNMFCYQPPCGQLDPTKAEVYNVLKDIYAQMCTDFDLDLFHMGGDEVHVGCWQSVQTITQWMDFNGYVNSNSSWTPEQGNPKYMKLLDYFQRNALAQFDSVCTPENKKLPIILWSSHFTNIANIHYLDKDRYIIHIWTTATNPQVAYMLQKGFKVIISNYDRMYLDCGVSSSTTNGSNWCSPYKGWQLIYDNRPSLVVGTYTSQVLGGITPLWTEQCDDATVDARVWPRAAAYAERTWSDPPEDFRAAVPRMLAHRERLVKEFGIRAELLQPEWCRAHAAHCLIDGLYNV